MDKMRVLEVLTDTPYYWFGCPANLGGNTATSTVVKY